MLPVLYTARLSLPPINELGRGVEGSGRDLIEGKIPVFAWRKV
jgi:hypothetical protein